MEKIKKYWKWIVALCALVIASIVGFFSLTFNRKLVDDKKVLKDSKNAINDSEERIKKNKKFLTRISGKGMVLLILFSFSCSSTQSVRYKMSPQECAECYDNLKESTKQLEEMNHQLIVSREVIKQINRKKMSERAKYAIMGIAIGSSVGAVLGIVLGVTIPKK